MIYQLQGIAAPHVDKVQVLEPSPRMRCIRSHGQMGMRSADCGKARMKACDFSRIILARGTDKSDARSRFGHLGQKEIFQSGVRFMRESAATEGYQSGIRIHGEIILDTVMILACRR